MGQVSPTHHPSFSAKAPRLHEIEVLDPYVPLLNLIFDQGIGSGLVQKEGGWAGGYGMDKMLVAYGMIYQKMGTHEPLVVTD